MPYRRRRSASHEFAPKRAQPLLGEARKNCDDCGPREDRESESRAKQTVMVVGGNGGLSDRYREVAAEVGWDLIHYEKKVPPGARHGLAHVALVVVMVGMVSHTLRDEVRSLSAADAPPDSGPPFPLTRAEVESFGFPPDRIERVAGGELWRAELTRAGRRAPS